MEDCSEPITEEEFVSLKTEVGDCIAKLEKLKFNHSALEARNKIYPNILKKCNAIRIIDFHI